MHKKINPIIRTFPEFEEKIEFLFLTDENFHDLCEDYLLCVDNVLKMKKEASKNSVRIKEYEDLKSSLQQEIMHIINKAE